MTGLPLAAQGLGSAALTEGVVEDDDIGPLGVFLPIAGFGDEAVGDVAFLLVVDVIADVVAFLENLPSDIADES